MRPEFKDDIQRIDDYLKRHFQKRRMAAPSAASANFAALFDSIQYSLFTGGKRFRPLLSLLTAEALKLNKDKVLPFAAAVEMIHTYSLIHDDLPAMDNDDMRRGQPTNHKKFGEDIAILAGDALLTEAFSVLTELDFPADGVVKTVAALSHAAGALGMVGGQVLDIAFENTSDIPADILRHTHELKTGALISVSVQGVGFLAGADKDTQHNLKFYGDKLGFAFQLADDLEDFDPKKPEAASYPRLLGLEKTQNLLRTVSADAILALKTVDGPTDKLKSIVEFNGQRVRKG